ncbi:MAG: hypothetical protein AB1585_17680 [Thermodesulfobacteriota bacterium]
MKKVFSYILTFFVVLSLVTVVSVTQAADSMTGTWRVNVQDPPDPRAAILTFILQQEGEQIVGTLHGPYGEKKVKGKIQGTDFELKYFSVINITYKGKVESNKISGTVDFENVGLRSFKGEKQ